MHDTLKTTAPTQIWHEVKIKAAPRAVFAALTQPEQLAKWWIPDTRGESAIGKRLQFRFGDFLQAMQVTGLVPDALVRWQPTEEGVPDWAGTELEFTIAAGDDDRSVVRIRQSGYRDDVQAFPYYSMSWAIRLISLKELLEKGTGRPFPNEWDV